MFIICMSLKHFPNYTVIYFCQTFTADHLLAYSGHCFLVVKALRLGLFSQCGYPEIWREKFQWFSIFAHKTFYCCENYGIPFSLFVGETVHAVSLWYSHSHCSPLELVAAGWMTVWAAPSCLDWLITDHQQKSYTIVLLFSNTQATAVSTHITSVRTERRNRILLLLRVPRGYACFRFRCPETPSSSHHS